MMRWKAEMEKVFSGQHSTPDADLIKLITGALIPVNLSMLSTCQIQLHQVISNLNVLVWRTLNYTGLVLRKRFALCMPWLVGDSFAVLLLWFAKQPLLKLQFWLNGQNHSALITFHRQLHRQCTASQGCRGLLGFTDWSFILIRINHVLLDVFWSP